MNTIICPGCKTLNPTDITRCQKCSLSLESEVSSQEELYLEFRNVQLKTWGAARQGMELRLHGLPPDTTAARIDFSCETYDLASCQGAVFNGDFTKKYTFALPDELAKSGGTILLKFTVTLDFGGRTTKRYQGDAFFDIIGTKWRKEMYKQALEGMALRIKTKGGRVYGGNARTGSIKEIVIENDFGLVDLENLVAEGNNYVRWRERLDPIQSPTHLVLKWESRTLHVFCKGELLLGKQGDLSLTGDGRISRRHLALFASDGQWYLRDLSLHGTDLGQKKPSTDGPIELEHGMCLGIPHPHSSNTYRFEVDLRTHPGHLRLQEVFRPLTALLLNPKQPTAELEGFAIQWTPQGFIIKPRARVALRRNGRFVHAPVEPWPGDRFDWGDGETTMVVKKINA